MEVQEAEEDERPLLAVGSDSTAHVVDVAVQLRKKYVYVLPAVELWKCCKIIIKNEMLSLFRKVSPCRRSAKYQAVLPFTINS